MEEGETEQKFFVWLRLGTLFKVFDIESFISTQDILSQATGRLKSHFH